MDKKAKAEAKRLRRSKRKQFSGEASSPEPPELDGGPSPEDTEPEAPDAAN